MFADSASRQTATSVSANRDLQKEIARLRELDLDNLRARWRIVFRRAPADHLPRNLLFRILAYQLQVETFGGLDKESVDTLNHVRANEKGGTGKVVAEKLRQKDAKLRPGTILTREWNNGVHRVTVLQDGFSWEGRSYNSLSAVASAIAGSRWNGRRFFGLTQKSGSRGRS